jgi:hypothetical protein
MLDKLKGWLAAAGAALAAILWAFFKGKKEGKNEEQAKQNKASLDMAKKSAAIRQEVKNKPSGDLRYRD